MCVMILSCSRCILLSCLLLSRCMKPNHSATWNLLNCFSWIEQEENNRRREQASEIMGGWVSATVTHLGRVFNSWYSALQFFLTKFFYNFSVFLQSPVPDVMFTGPSDFVTKLDLCISSASWSHLPLVKKKINKTLTSSLEGEYCSDH